MVVPSAAVTHYHISSGYHQSVLVNSQRSEVQGGSQVDDVKDCVELHDFGGDLWEDYVCAISTFHWLSIFLVIHFFISKAKNRQPRLSYI